MTANLTILPTLFHIEPGAIHKSGEILEAHGLSCRRSLIVCGKASSRAFAEATRRSLDSDSELYSIDGATERASEDVGQFARSNRKGLLVAVGGGAVIDVVKRAGRLYNIPVVVVPTIVSNDGLVSPISVLSGEGGRSRSLPAAMPLGAIVDLDVIMNAPHHFLQASGGDLLSNLSATTDWERMAKKGWGPPLNDVAFHLSRNSAENIVFASDASLASPRYVRSLIIAQIYSGIAMSLAGTSRPCSGPEHLISHAIDEMDLTPGVLHGAQVGSICLFILDMLGELTPEIEAFAALMGIPPAWTDLSPGVSENLPGIIERSRVVRPDRATFLDEFTDGELLERIKEFAARRSATMGRSAA
jgi:glycerol-1-phosphate dehydrogenase [NAD(P)+]